MALQNQFDKQSFQGSRARHFAPRPSKAPSVASFPGGGAFPSYRKCPMCQDTGEVRCTGGEWDEVLDTFCECQIGQELQRAEDEIFGVAA